MERLSWTAKALRVGLSPEEQELSNASKICRFLDAALTEIPASVLTRMERIRAQAMLVQRHEPLHPSGRSKFEG